MGTFACHVLTSWACPMIQALPHAHTLMALSPFPCSCLFFNTGRVQSSLLPEKMGLPADVRGDIVCETKGNVQAIVRRGGVACWEWRAAWHLLSDIARFG